MESANAIADATSTIGLRAYVLIQLPVILIGGAVGLWLFYIQHQFEQAYWVRRESWNPMSSRCRVARILTWILPLTYQGFELHQVSVQ